jgi:hypothetical protein
VSSKETTSGRFVIKLHVPREIMRAARLNGMAFTVNSPIKVVLRGIEDDAMLDGTFFHPGSARELRGS